MTRQVRRFAVFTFVSTHDALDAERLLLDLGIDVVPIPSPASAAAICGIALRAETHEAQRAAGYLEAAGIEVAEQLEIEDI